MRRAGVEQAIARHLLTDQVLEHLVRAGEPTVEDDRLVWRSWPQQFSTTTGPWQGIGGAAITTFQVTVARDDVTGLVLVFAASDLFSYGCPPSWAVGSIVDAEGIDFGRLGDDLGMSVLDRPLP